MTVPTGSIEYCCGTMFNCLEKGFIYVDDKWVMMRLDDNEGAGDGHHRIIYEDLSIQYCPFCGKEPVSTEKELK